MDGVQIINADAYDNSFAKICLGAFLIWGGSLFVGKTLFSKPIHKYSNRNQHSMNEKNKLNKSILHKNKMRNGLKNVPNFLQRRKMMNFH